MDQDYHNKVRARSKDGEPPPGLALRRRGDRCFHAVEEVVREGYIVEGLLILVEDVAEMREDAAACARKGGSSS